MDEMQTAVTAQPAAPRKHSLPYIVGTLAIILIANILNYADRSILSVLAEPVKQDLGISDAQLGFLYGTSFVLLNAIMGIAMARLTDIWLRHHLLAIGVGLWSAMTALSGLASSYAQIATARFGVGVGESTIAPVAHAVLADIVPPSRRGLVYAFYLSGPFLGSALALSAGGWLVDHWGQICGAGELCGFKGWQAAFLIFGLSGIGVALLVPLVGEPVDVERRRRARPVAEALAELSSLIPPFTFFRLAQLGGGRTLRANLIAVGAIAALTFLLVRLTHSPAQWIAVGFAAYAATSWVQALKYRDPALYALTVASPAFVASTLGIGVAGLISASASFWTVPLAMRSFEVSHSEAGAALGLAIGLGAFAGTLLGGVVSDWARRFSHRGGLWLGGLSMLGSGLSLIWLVSQETLTDYAMVLALVMACCSLWPAAIASLVQDLILPSMRGRASSMFSLTVALMALSLGPYTVGKIADLSGSIVTGLASLYIAVPFALGLLLYAGHALPAALARRDATPTA